MTADPIGPGDYLEAKVCLKNKFAELTRGRIYICEDAAPMDAETFCGIVHPGIDCFGVRLKEVPVPWPLAWCSTLFNPVRRPDTDQLLRYLDINGPPSVEGPVRRDMAKAGAGSPPC